MDEGKKYVVYGMRLRCNQGSMENYLSTNVGHGVVYQGQPVMNANDHQKGIHLTHFGDCSSKAVFEEAKKEADEKYKAEEGDGFFTKAGKWLAKNVTKAAVDVKATFMSNKCELVTPLPWLFTSEDHTIDGAPALMMESLCPCALGGVISIVPVVEEMAEESAVEETEEELITTKEGPLLASAGEVKVSLQDKQTMEHKALEMTKQSMMNILQNMSLGASLNSAVVSGALKALQEVTIKDRIYIGRYPLKYIEGIIKSYETHKIEDGRYVLDNNGKTIALGHDVRLGEDFSNGLSMEEGLALAIKDLDGCYALVEQKIKELNAPVDPESDNPEEVQYNIDINDFSEDELMMLVDFAYNRWQGLVKRPENVYPKSSLAILIVAISEKDYERVNATLMEEIKGSESGEVSTGLIRRRMDEYEMMAHGDYTRDYDLERDYINGKK